jgi:hypothetical protein
MEEWRLVKHRTRNIWFGIVAVWAAYMLALSPYFVALHRETKSVERAFAEYTNSLVNRRFSEAYSSCGTDFRSAMSYEQFVSTFETLQKQYGPLMSARRVAYEVHGSGKPVFWRAVIDADFAYEKKTLRFEFVFHKEDDRWVVFGAERL